MKTQYLEYAERDVYMDRLKETPENNSCFDCAKKAPKWSSNSFGILLCLDCSGKHRELGPQISFVRSLTLDDWTLKQVMHLELGGNKNCAEHFKRYGLTKPFDYKQANAQKYKQELLRKVEAFMAAQSGATNGANVVAEKPQEKPEAKPNTFFEAPANNATLTKSVSEPEKVEPVPTIDKNSTKAKNFSVEFASKGGNTGKKGIQAKKITNFDLEGLSMEENNNTTEKKETGMGTQFSLGATAEENTATTTTTTSNSNPWGEPKSNSYSGYGSNSYEAKESNENAQEKFQKFSNAKSISSDAFYGKNNDEPAFNTNKFSGQRAISSNQVFGREEEDDDSAQGSNATVDKLKAGASYLGEKAFDWGGKLKEKAGGWMSKFKTSEWAS